MEPQRRNKLLFFLSLGILYLFYACLLIWLATFADRLIKG